MVGVAVRPAGWSDGCGSLWAAANRAFHPVSQGQLAGRCQSAALRRDVVVAQ